MHIILQLAIGMIPLLLVVILMYFRKKHRIVSTAMLLLVGVCLFFAFRNSVIQKESDQTKEQTIYLAQRYMEEEDYTQAGKIIDQVSQSYGDSYDTAVNRARLMLLQGKIEAAGAEYEKAMLYETKKRALSEDEREFAKRIIGGEVQSMARLHQTGAIATYIESVGQNPVDYSYEASGSGYMAMAEVIDTGVSRVLDCMEEETDEYGKKDNAQALDDGLDLKKDLNALVDQYTLSGTVDEKEAKSVAGDMEELYTTNPELFTDGLLEDSHLEAMVLDQDYDKVVELAEQGNLDALLMTANLYQNGKIDENSFSNEFSSENADGYEEVVERCEDILIDYENKMSVEDEENTDAAKELSLLQDKVDTLKIILDNLALAEVRQRAKEQLVEVSEENLSKTLLQLAGIDYYLGDIKQGDQDFEDALEKASLCSDDNYTEPLYNIMEVISGNETDNNIKDTTAFAEQAYKEATSPVLATDNQGASNFSGSVTNYVSTKTAMLNIGSIDTSQFPKITVEVQFGEAPADLDTVLEVLDVGEGITNYKLTKKDYKESDIVLACDMSGSMEGSEESLQSAISQFVDQMSSKENVSLVGFDDMIQFDTGYTRDKTTLYDSAQLLVPTGGTNIYGALIYSIGTMKLNQDASKIIIAMTDGQDNVMPDISQLNDLRNLCNYGDIIVYTIGLGDVYEEYLNDLASRGNGQFVYCSEAESLKTLYKFIHKQIDNTYELTFEATNQTENERVLKLTDMENNCNDSKTYYRKDESEEASNNTTDYMIGNDAVGVAVTGMEQRAIYKSDCIDMPLKALGYGFSTLKDVKVSLTGSRKTYSDLTGTVIDDTHISFAVPKGAILDTYDIELRSNGKTYLYEDAFTVYEPGKRGVVNFGAYSFEADNVSKTSGGYLLKGNVLMNQFLHFKGEITLTGDTSAQNITLNDSSGAYVNCSRALPGVMKVFLTNTIDVPSFGAITLYNDEAHKYNLDEYYVDSYSVNEVTQLNALILESGSISLYPDRIQYDKGRLCLDFPCQEIVFNIAKNENVFSFDTSSSFVLNGEALGLIAEVSTEADKGIHMGSLPIKLKELEININTLKNDYLIDGTVGIAGSYEKMFEGVSAGAKLEWKAGLWDTAMIRVDKDVTLPTTCPVTLSNFYFGLQEMSKVDQGSDIGKIILGSYITGRMDVGVGKLSEVIKPLKTFLGDLSVCTFEETTLKGRWYNFSLILSTKPKLFGEIDMGEAELKIGNFDYDNYLLGINNVEAKGLYLKVKTGFLWDTSNVDIDVSGEGILTLNNYFAGVENTGTVSYDVNVLWIKAAENVQGKILVGFHNQGKQFSILIKGTDMKNNKQCGVFLSLHQGTILPDVKFY